MKLHAFKLLISVKIMLFYFEFHARFTAQKLFRCSSGEIFQKVFIVIHRDLNFSFTEIRFQAMVSIKNYFKNCTFYLHILIKFPFFSQMASFKYFINLYNLTAFISLNLKWTEHAVTIVWYETFRFVWLSPVATSSELMRSWHWMKHSLQRSIWLAYDVNKFTDFVGDEVPSFSRRKSIKSFSCLPAIEVYAEIFQEVSRV